jgi:hypothetical protein
MTFKDPYDILITRYEGWTSGSVFPFVRFSADISNLDPENFIEIYGILSQIKDLNFFKETSGENNFKKFVVNTFYGCGEENISVVEISWTAPAVPALVAPAAAEMGTTFFFSRIFYYGEGS